MTIYNLVLDKLTKPETTVDKTRWHLTVCPGRSIIAGNEFGRFS